MKDTQRNKNKECVESYYITSCYKTGTLGAEDLGAWGLGELGGWGMVTWELGRWGPGSLGTEDLGA